MIVAQRIDTALHVGTHFDGAMHATDNRKGDMASLPLDYLVNRGVVVDISPWVADWSVIFRAQAPGSSLRSGQPARRTHRPTASTRSNDDAPFPIHCA
jgi:hypothetical protein